MIFPLREAPTRPAAKGKNWRLMLRLTFGKLSRKAGILFDEAVYLH
jgi:hypothetical protein